MTGRICYWRTRESVTLVPRIMEPGPFHTSVQEAWGPRYLQQRKPLQAIWFIHVGRHEIRNVDLHAENLE